MIKNYRYNLIIKLNDKIKNLIKYKIINSNNKR